MKRSSQFYMDPGTHSPINQVDPQNEIVMDRAVVK